MSKNQRRRAADTRAVRAKLEGLPEPARGLPMPVDHDTGARLSRREWIEYRERRTRHLERFPKYDAGWRRPTDETAETVWNLLAPTLNMPPEAFFSEHSWLLPTNVAS